MKKTVSLAVFIILVAAAVPGYADLKTITFQNILAQPPSSWLFFPGFKVHVGWKLGNATGQEKMDVVVLKEGVLIKTLVSGMLNKYANMGNPNDSYWYNEYWWTLGPGDVGCHIQVQVKVQGSSLRITSHIFDVYPFLNVQKNGVYSYARLDTPPAGATLLLGMNYDIRWSMMAAPSAWPSGKINLKLMANVNGNIIHVGDIASVAISFAGCPVSGRYTWNVATLTNVTHPGKKPDGKNGINYRIRLTGDTSTYDSDDFKIGKLLVPLPVEKAKVNK